MLGPGRGTSWTVALGVAIAGSIAAWGLAAPGPVRIPPGDAAGVRVEGSYELVRTDEGSKANLHLAILARAEGRPDRISLGVNVHLRELHPLHPLPPGRPPDAPGPEPRLPSRVPPG